MNEEMFKKLKDAGIEGFEARTVAIDEAKRARESAEKFGLRIHSVIGGGSVAGLRAAQAYEPARRCARSGGRLQRQAHAGTVGIRHQVRRDQRPY